MSFLFIGRKCVVFSFFHLDFLTDFLKIIEMIDTIISNDHTIMEDIMVRLTDYTHELETNVLDMHLKDEQALYYPNPNEVLSQLGKDEHDHLCVILSQERPAGIVFMHHVSPTHYLLKAMMIDAAYQNRGVGKNAMLDVIQKLKNRNVRTVGTYLLKHNQRGLDFLLKTGFTIKEDRDQDYYLELQIYYY